MAMRKLVVYITVLIIFICGVFYKNSLQYELMNFLKNYKGADIGVAIIKEKSITVVNDKKYPLMSVFKYFVAVKVLNLLEEKNLDLNETLEIKEAMIDRNTYSPLLKKYSNFPIKMTIRELLTYMVAESDNNACDILIEYSGGMEELSAFIHDLGFLNIDIKFSEKEMNEDISKQYLNAASSKDVAKFMKFINEGSLLSETSLKFLDETMAMTQTGKNKLLAGLPDDAKLFHKTGTGSRTKEGIKIADNDAGYVIMPNGEKYYIAVFIKDSKFSDDKNAKIISDISKITYRHFLKSGFNRLISR